MLTAIGTRAKSFIDGSEPWTNVYGLARTMIALATAATLVATPMEALFHPLAGVANGPPFCSDALQSVGFFCVLPPERIQWMRWIAVAILLVVASGWRPRLTAIPHWWIAMSLAINAALIEGGDQVAAVLTLLLLPVALTDSRKWHWDPAPPRVDSLRSDARRLVARVAYTLVRVQVAVIYFHAAIGKLGAPEWQDGTALYYWLLHPTFGAPAWLAPAMRVALANGTFVTLLTWSVLVVEYALSAALFMPKRRWKVMLACGFALHGGIIVIHGLVSFGTVMLAALILFLRPWETSFSWDARGALTARRLARSASLLWQGLHARQEPLVALVLQAGRHVLAPLRAHAGQVRPAPRAVDPAA